MGDEVRDSIEKAYQRTTWGNTTVVPEDWKRIIEGDDEERKRSLFKHLFFESVDGSDLRELFSRGEIRTYLTDLDKPVARPHVERRRRVWRWVYCGVREAVPELDWPVPKNRGGVSYDGNR